jgi:hypothetical protein
MKRLKSALFASFIGLIFVVSCRRDDPSWDLDLTAPVAYGSLTLDNLLDDSITSQGADGSLRIAYHAAVPGISADTLFNIPDTTLHNTYGWLFGPAVLSPGTDLVTNQPTQTTYALSSAQLTYGVLERGKAKVRFRNDMLCDMVVSYTVESATLNNVPATVSYIVPAAPSSTQPSIMDVELDLSNYEIDFTGLNGDRVNTLVTVFSVSTSPNATPTPVSNADSVVMDITFEDLRPSYVRGYFGSDNIEIGPEESYISFFSRVQSGQLGLDSITMTFTLENYAGLDARFTVNNLWSRREATSQQVNLNHPLIGNPVNIDRAAYSFSYPPSIPAVYSWTFDNSNSNIVNMFEIMPDFLGYDFSLWTNPLGNVSGNNDFIYTKFGINAYIDVDMPVNFFADQIVLVDTIATDFGITNAEDVRKANLSLFVGNGFPFGTNVELFLLDENNNQLDQIITAPGMIASAPLAFSGGYYFANGATQSMLSIPLNEAQTAHLLSSSRILLKATLDTGTNPDYVKIFTTNRLDFNLTADFEYRVN